MSAAQISPATSAASVAGIVGRSVQERVRGAAHPGPVLAPELVDEHDRQPLGGRLPVALAVHAGVGREQAVVVLLLEQEVQRAVRADLVSRREQRGRDVVEVARPHPVVGRLAPRPALGLATNAPGLSLSSCALSVYRLVS